MTDQVNTMARLDWDGLSRRATEWAESQPWHGWALLPEGPERERKHAMLLEAWERREAAAIDAVRAQSQPEHEARARSIREQQMRQFGIPVRVWPALERLDDTAACRAVARWLSSDGWLLILAGGVGTGKTTSAAVACLAERGYMVTATQTADHLFDRPWWASLESQRLVAIDDLGTERRDGEGYWLDRWRAFLDAMYRDKRRVVVTTNIPRPLFVERYVAGDGGRTLERLRDGGMFSTVAGESMRFGADDGPATPTAEVTT